MIRNLIRYTATPGILMLMMFAATIPSGVAASQTPEAASVAPPVALVGSTVPTGNFELTLQLAEGSNESILRVDLAVTNTSTTPVDIEALTPTIEVYDRASRPWPAELVEGTYETTVVPQGGEFILEITATNTNVLAYNGPVFVRVGNLPDSDLTTFTVWYQNGVALVPESVPTNPLKDTQHPVGSDQTGTVARTQVPVVLNIDTMMPTLDELPEGLWTVNQGKLNQSAIASTFTDPAMADWFLNEWGWQENAHVYLEGAPTVDGITYVDIGIHRFNNEESALLAMDYYVLGRAEVMGMWEVDDPEFGVFGRTITNGVDTTAYMVIDNVVIRVSVAGSNPSPFATQIRQVVHNKANAQMSVSDALVLALNPWRDER